MSRFGWAYVSSVLLATGTVANGPTGSLQFHNSGQTLSGSSNLIFDSNTNDLILTGTMRISGTLYATEYQTTVVSASILYSSGSTKFGDDASDNHQFTGSIYANGISGTVGQYTSVTASNITIGVAESGDNVYTDGLFTTFTSTTPLGLVVDRFNEVLKGLAPQPAPSLSNLEKNVAGGTSMNLSFGNSSPTASYTNVTASLSGLSNVDIGSSYSVTNGSGGQPIRLGVFAVLTDLTATLNNNVSADANIYTNYPDNAYNVPVDGIGSYIIEMNDIQLTPTGSTVDTSSYNSNNFSLSTANTASFIVSGQSFDLFRHRTGTINIPTSSWRLGENYLKVTHESSLGTHVTNYIDWIYDPEAAAGNSVYSFTTTSSSFAITGEKALSGVKYYNTCSFNFTSSIANYYKNVYSTAGNGGITFGSLTTGLTATSFTSTPVPANSEVALERSSLHTLAGVRVLSASVSSTININNGLGKTGASTLTTPKILFDAVDTANTNTLENFCLENYRVSSASYDTQISLTTAATFPSSSALASSELAVYNGGLVYPTKILNAGNVDGSGITYMISGQPNYSTATEDRYYYRKFVNGASTLASFNLILTGSNIDFVAYNGSLTANNIKIAIKVPGRTGWRDALTAAPANTSGIASNDNVGCLAGSAPANITTSAGRSISINLLTEAIQANESYLVRILVSKDWAGAITKLQIS
jgi:hypothetical protein